MNIEGICHCGGDAEFKSKKHTRVGALIVGRGVGAAAGRQNAVYFKRIKHHEGPETGGDSHGCARKYKFDWRSGDAPNAKKPLIVMRVVMKERAAAVIPLEIGVQRWPERRAESCCELRMHGRRLPGASCVHLADGTVAARSPRAIDSAHQLQDSLGHLEQ